MKISTRARYGLRGLFDIAYHNAGRPTHVQDISRRQDVTPRYLEQIFQSLKKEGLVAAQRGPRGGYFLGRPAEQISVGDVVRATEGPIALDGPEDAAVPEDGRPEDPDPVGAASRGLTHLYWAELSAEIGQMLDRTTLAELCRRAERAGVPRESDPRRLMYFI